MLLAINSPSISRLSGWHRGVVYQEYRLYRTPPTSTSMVSMSCVLWYYSYDLWYLDPASHYCCWGREGLPSSWSVSVISRVAGAYRATGPEVPGYGLLGQFHFLAGAWALGAPILDVCLRRRGSPTSALVFKWQLDEAPPYSPCENGVFHKYFPHSEDYVVHTLHLRGVQ